MNGTCTRCKRPLKNPASVQHGMGPVCYAKSKSEGAGDDAGGDGTFCDLPFDPDTCDVVCSRDVLSEVRFDVAVCAQKLKAVWMGLDLAEINPWPSPGFPAVLLSSVPMVEVEGGGAAVVPAPGALATELVAQGLPDTALLRSPALLLAGPAPALPSLVTLPCQLLATVEAESRPLQIDARALVVTEPAQLAALLAALRAPTREAQPALAVGAIRDGRVTSFAEEGRVLSQGMLLLDMIPKREIGSKRGVLHCNIPRLVVVHSPTGFEIGYGGSGPSDFALNVLEFFARRFHGLSPDEQAGRGDDGKCTAFAWAYHHDFKRQFIARLPEQGGSIPGATVKAWVEERLAEWRRTTGAGAELEVADAVA